MALLARRPFNEVMLEVDDGSTAHILEPEFHQDIYRNASERAKASANGAFQIGTTGLLTRPAGRGKQPIYADHLDEPEELRFQGQMLLDGTRRSDSMNVVALKSVAVRWGYVDLAAGRSVSQDYFAGHAHRSGIERHDVLVNSTGDGTIGRVAIYDYDFPAVADGHVTILRFAKPALAWYVASYLLSPEGQKQIYRYINGSSGQVEIYPQDLSRIWVPHRTDNEIEEIGQALKVAVQSFEHFQTKMASAMSLAQAPS